MKDLVIRDLAMSRSILGCSICDVAIYLQIET
jgi:hypothetical protein